MRSPLDDDDELESAIDNDFLAAEQYLRQRRSSR